MDVYTSTRMHFGAEHREFAMDMVWLVINYTPLTGVIYTLKFGQKWLHEKRMPHRVARYLERNDRKNFIKTRSRRIMMSRLRALN